MAILKGHKMVPGLDPGCDIMYKIIRIQCSLHILALVQVTHYLQCVWQQCCLKSGSNEVISDELYSY